MGHADEFALELIANILSAGKSSRLFRALVYEKQIAVYAGGSYDGLSNGPSLFYFYSGVKPGVDVDVVEKAIYEELEKLKKFGVTERELQKAKNQVEASFIMNQDSIFYQAMQIGRLQSADIEPSYLDDYLENIRKVSKEDIQRVADKYFVADQRTVGILVPLKKGGGHEK